MPPPQQRFGGTLERSEISWCTKYFLFVFNVFVWFLGVGILTVGIWSWTQKEKFSNLSRITHITLDPAFFLIIIGLIIFIVGFTGCLGALREIPTLLTIYMFSVLAILVTEVAIVIILTNFKDWIKTEAADGFDSLIVHYREDPDQQNLIDWIQYDWLECCGIEGPKDWDRNNYFNCSSQEIGSREACGVPFSCCKRQHNEVVRNKQCGYDVRKNNDSYDVSKVIYEKGCIQALEEWLERYLLHIVMGVILSTFCKLIVVLLTQHLRSDIDARKYTWH